MKESVSNFIGQGTQARPRGEDLWYCPARDITTILPLLVSQSLEAWEDENNEHRKLGDRRLYTDDDVCKVAEALAGFMSEECIVNTSSYKEAFDKSGLLDLPIGARNFVFGIVAEEVVCAFWYAARAATIVNKENSDGHITQYDPNYLAARAKEMTKLFRMPTWKRFFFRIGMKIRASVLRVFGASNDSTSVDREESEDVSSDTNSEDSTCG